nr:cation transporter [Actinomycetota bacterium]
RAAGRLDSRSLQADSKQTSLCAYLSAILLAGLLGNAWFGWWWADPIAGIAIAAVALNEGRELWKTDDFCCA